MSEPINSEQVRVIKKLEEVLNLLKNVTVKNEESLAVLDEPLDDILSNLKYLPTDPSFDTLPTEIKADIFSYLCDSRAFVAASVNQEWKSIMEGRLMNMEELTIGKHCSSEYECENNECFVSEEILKASIVLKIDIPLAVCHPLHNVDSNIIVEALSSVSNLSIEGECSCVEDEEKIQPIMRKREFKKLFNALNDRSEVLENLKLVGLDLRSLNQKKLVECLLNNTHSLTLDGGDFHNDDELITLGTLVKGLLQVSEDSKLKQLTLLNLNSCMLNDEDNLEDEDFAEAFCKVYSVHLDWSFIVEDMIKPLIDNILNRPITLKKIKISEEFDWDTLIEPDELKTLIEKMSGVDLIGVFSPEQVETVKSLPGVEASVGRISKGELDWRK